MYFFFEMPIFIWKIKTFGLERGECAASFPSQLLSVELLLLAPLRINMQYPFNQSIKNELLTTRAELRPFFFFSEIRRNYTLYVHNTLAHKKKKGFIDPAATDEKFIGKRNKKKKKGPALGFTKQTVQGVKMGSRNKYYTQRWMKGWEEGIE